MPRYIDADALKELIDGGFDIDFDEVPETKKALLNMIDYQETADVVEIVRCKDCKHNSLNRMRGNAFCDLGTGLSQIYDFCSKGERGDDDAEIH